MKNNLNEKLEELIKFFFDKKLTAGANVLVLKNGKEVAYAQYGFGNIEKNRPYARDTIFRLYSMTKPITAAATIHAASLGKLDLTANVSDYLPEFSDMYVTDSEGKTREKATHQIAVQDLLNMSSGLAYPNEAFEGGRQSAKLFEEIDQRLYSDSPMTTAEFATKAAKLDLCFDPSTHFLYGISADVLGALIEKISGMKFSEYLKKYLFEPLEMNDTGFVVPKEKQERFAAIYDCTGSEFKETYTNHLGNRYLKDVEPAFESGGAGLVSTLDDYAKFATMLMDGGCYKGKQVLTKAAVRFLTQGGPDELSHDLQSHFDWMRGYTYGNLMRCCRDASRSSLFTGDGEYGWDGWLGPFFSNDPEHKTTVLMGTQVFGMGCMGTFARRLLNLINSEIND